MRIYVQSCGVSQDNDYCWLKIRHNRSVREIPPILKRPLSGHSQGIVRVTDVIESQSLSMVVARDDGELLLLLTGLPAREERTDFMGRRVRNSVAWVGEDSDEGERFIRSLVVRVLSNELEVAEAIDRAIVIGGEYGFDASFEALNLLAEPLSVNINRNADATDKVGKSSPILRQELALELESNCLSDREGLLIVLTSLKTQSAILEARVWRGLSSRIAAEGWITSSSSIVQKKTISKTAVGAAIAAALPLAIWILKLLFP
ncbi:MAG: hypothetical protein SW833_02740 [Cyanobacteriota bacterium]|nr:hypothetical protein [Cyanobacteriota bacterium]